MWLKTLCIIFCISAPQICTADAELSPQKNKLSVHNKTSKKPEKQATPAKAHEFANLALENFLNENHTSALIQIEKSLNLNPYNPKSYSLRSQILNKLQVDPDQIIPIYVYFLRALPAPLIIALFGLLSLYSSKQYGRFKRLEKESLKANKDVQLKSYLTAFASFVVLILVFLKISHQNHQWACLTNSQELYSGPSSKLPIIKSLNSGSCFIKRKTNKEWTAIKASRKSTGWLKNTAIKEIQPSD